ncbi:general secretion pathway protein J [Rhodopseudomonas rhenobacensis]|uniref:General secretion pathway protein J n=1 Tax=Rhodopseudomonas rhenobacensis TaxID=87461 RepID=A0A7W7Z5U1_9BRAD|nr:general secretion pathway protein GspJ [Rhodopseudomonas rhenobacensis]MBB5048565.1 general secretion pathway protein J [Rhodopseudomonas rhenobacensis]
MTAGKQPVPTGEAGFIMLEMLIAIVLTVVIFVALATVTAQWIPNWNRGIAQVQQLEKLGTGLDRVVADLAEAQFVAFNAAPQALAFLGTPLSVTFVRPAIGPSARPGLELIRLAERADNQGLALVRERAVFRPSDTLASVQFGDPVVLIRNPYRVSFSYAERSQQWASDWAGSGKLPAMIRVAVREAVSDRVIVASTVAVIQADMAAECIKAKDLAGCLATGHGDEGAKPAGAAAAGDREL